MGRHRDDEARREIGRPNAAFLAGVWYALFPSFDRLRLTLHVGNGVCAVLATAAWLAFDGGNEKRKFGFAAAGGALAAFAIYLRYQNGLIGVGLFLTLLARRRWWDLLYFSVAAFVVGMMGGFLDKLTWGDWFHSFFTYWKFNVVEWQSVEKWGRVEASYYATTVWTSTGWPLVLIGIGFLLSLRRAAILMLTICPVHGRARRDAAQRISLHDAGRPARARLERRRPRVDARENPWKSARRTDRGMDHGSARSNDRRGALRQSCDITFCDMGAFCDVEMGKHAPWHQKTDRTSRSGKRASTTICAAWA